MKTKPTPIGSDATERGADISPCGRYRYTLWRKWGSGGIELADDDL